MRKKREENGEEELPAPCNLLWERRRRSQREGNTQQGGSSREQRPFTLTHTHTHTLTFACKHTYEHF